MKYKLLISLSLLAFSALLSAQNYSVHNLAGGKQIVLIQVKEDTKVILTDGDIRFDGFDKEFIVFEGDKGLSISIAKDRPSVLTLVTRELVSSSPPSLDLKVKESLSAMKWVFKDLHLNYTTLNQLMTKK